MRTGSESRIGEILAHSGEDAREGKREENQALVWGRLRSGILIRFAVLRNAEYLSDENIVKVEDVVGFGDCVHANAVVQRDAIQVFA